MKKIITTFLIATLTIAGVKAQNYIPAGNTTAAEAKEAPACSEEFLQVLTDCFSKSDADKLADLFDSNLEVSLMNKSNTSSRIQARQIMRSFFRDYQVKEFTIDHTAQRLNLKYILADLKAGGERFHVIIFLSGKDEDYRIQQLKIIQVRY